MTEDVKKNGYTLRTNKYKQDAFRPQPDLRVSPKSRRHHPVLAGTDYCPRRNKRNKQNRVVKRCARSPMKCDVCFAYNQFKEKK